MYKKGRVNSNSRIISTDEDPSLRIESSAIINLRGVSTKLNKYIVFTMQTYKKLKKRHCLNNPAGNLLRRNGCITCISTHIQDGGQLNVNQNMSRNKAVIKIL